MKNELWGTHRTLSHRLRSVLACTVAGSLLALAMPFVTDRVGPLVAASQFTIAVQGMDNGLYVNHGGGYAGLGGATSAAPAVVSAPLGGGTADLYIVTGADHHLWERTDTIGWQLLAGTSIYCVDNPAAMVSGNALTVACQGADHAIWFASTTFPAAGLPTLRGFASLGGWSRYGPAVAAVNGGSIFFVVGSDSKVYWRTAGSWWLAVGNVTCASHPGAAGAGTTGYVACRSTTGALVYAVNTGSAWSSVRNLGGIIFDGPGAAATASGATFAVRGGGGAIYTIAVSSTGASSGWQSVGGASPHGAAITAELPASSPASGTSAGSASSMVQYMLNIINHDRAVAGLPPYTLNMAQSTGTGSCVGSYGHSIAMQQSGSIWHVNSSYPQASFPRDICMSYSTAGENVGMAQTGSESNDLQTVDNLMMSETHSPSYCATNVNHACNILSTKYTQVGVGIVDASNGTWVTEDFAG